MKKRILQICLTLALILLIIIAIQFIRSNNQGTPNQQHKGNPFEQPAQKKEQSEKTAF